MIATKKPILRAVFQILLVSFLATASPAEQTTPDWDAELRAEWESEAPGFSLETIGDILARTEALRARLALAAPEGPWPKYAKDLAGLRAQLEPLRTQSVPEESARRTLYFEARQLLREMAFRNPMLDFDRLLFIKRHHAGGVFHMCDQFYGFNAKPGGGLFVLEHPFGTNPKVIDVLKDATVEQGRLAGQTLEGGAFLSPELSYDGKTILFAYTQARGKDLEWTPESAWHIFRVQADGTGLAQLTDGPCDDFDPCFLPGGRIAFITERRGGYLRCGRHCPTYTTFSMEPDGSDIVCLSFHETHEWQPSVNHEGMLVYTRWDYVDRDTNVAHHIWTSYPDGRDPRSFHGNYPGRREDRPWMEMDIRAIPGSHRYVATAAAHHGHAFGSLVMIDPRPEDDGGMAQLTRLTPDTPFPEAEKNLRPIEQCMVYGTPWPLSEDDYICAYAADSKHHGLYWIDRFGNRELLYRDPEIPSMSPIPLRPRSVPPVLPEATTQTARAKQTQPERPATVAVMNVYDSDFAWPEGIEAVALRIIQALPKTTPPPNEPRIGVAEQTNARAILGTVPIEADGSVYFEAPPGKVLYFQAVDRDGMAIQSMRSGTYLHPGEQMTCLGCHERKRETAKTPPAMPMALHRAPSKIAPEAEGSNPFSYVRLVQPAIDRNCVACHQEKGALDLSGTVEGAYGWSRSYTNLAKQYGFYYDVSNGSINNGVHGGVRTPPGAFGARASALLPFLSETHYGLKLPQEDRRRITLWLDANSEFFGAYENTLAQSQGEVVRPALD